MSLVAISIILSILVSIIIAVNVYNRRSLSDGKVSLTIAKVAEPSQVVSPEFLQCPVNFEGMVQRLIVSHDEKLEDQLRKDLQVIGATRVNALACLPLDDRENENLIAFNFFTTKVMLLENFIGAAQTNEKKAKYQSALTLSRSTLRKYEGRTNKVQSA